MRILIVDDQRSARRVLRQMLASLDGIEILEASGMEDAMSAIERSPPDLLLLDVRLSDDPRDRGGLDILRKVRAAGRLTPAVMVTSVSELNEIREAMRLGAQDYVLKDELCPEMLLPIVEGQRERLTLKGEVARLRERVDRTWGTRAILGSSPAIERVRRLIERVAESNSTVLIRGETGSGKEMVARALHEVSSRRGEPFVAVNCSALPGTLIESLIFGHERGAFTGAERRTRGQLELAGAGTILLDEIAEMPGEMQAKLLRVLEDRRFRPLGSEIEIPLRARVLAATHVDLEKRIGEGRFREDLFYRLNVVTIYLPSLAERENDLMDLLLAFTAELPRRLRYTDESIQWLLRRSWPGNVRELRNLVERLALLADDDVIDVPTLEELARERPILDTSAEVDRIARALLALPERLGSKLRVIERAVLHQAIESCGGNKAAAARLIGVDRKMLERRWDRHSTVGGAPSGDEGPPSSRRLESPPSSRRLESPPSSRRLTHRQPAPSDPPTNDD
ncbi:sigma-54-dependent transcriptional regulator [Chondromyces apiculatus]|uniref:Response regulator of zinc sigma-54-dependent two-component system n=1 Tax=Chondromyces apiculatus DSM 436 TaxID=1192034 RepID=A0A017T6E5_9BACT|nr:sigma-54 dependent transcriptional regulator [Chondromyces apiculatus]EYF04804.1 Response regulator of zinc sigma-54-dependent two-component system [Chondromyces apiculatus DSM 436]